MAISVVYCTQEFKPAADASGQIRVRGTSGCYYCHFAHTGSFAFDENNITQRKKKAMKSKVFSLRWCISRLTLLTMLLGMVACGERETPTAEPVTSPTPTEVAPTRTATADPELGATFEEADCPFEVPKDAVVECGFVVVP